MFHLTYIGKQPLRTRIDTKGHFQRHSTKYNENCEVAIAISLAKSSRLFHFYTVAANVLSIDVNIFEQNARPNEIKFSQFFLSASRSCGEAIRRAGERIARYVDWQRAGKLKERKGSEKLRGKVSVEGGIESAGNDVPSLFQNASQIQVRLVGGGAITSRPTIYINEQLDASRF